MKYLFINSATTNLVVAIISSNKVLYLYDNNDSNDTSSKIMPVIFEAFNQSNLTPENIDKIFVVNGPGSFTGIRVGLTVAKIMAYSLNIPLISLSSLELMASGFDEDITSLIDARRGYVFAGKYDKELNAIYKDNYVLLDNLDLKGTIVSYDSFNFEVKNPKLDIVKIIKKHENDKPINPHELKPNYLKLTEAEEKKLKNEQH